jgi:hypothetical protein
MPRIIRHDCDGTDWAFMAHITVRQEVKGARRVTHEYYADYTEVLWGHAIEFLSEGFSVISVEMYTCE